MAARGDGVEGDERVWVVVVGRGEPGWRLSVEGEFGCELELGAAMVAAVRLGCASRELCVGKKNKGEREGGVGCFGSAREAGQLLQAPGRGWPWRERRLARCGCRRAAVASGRRDAACSTEQSAAVLQAVVATATQARRSIMAGQRAGVHAQRAAAG